MFCQAYKRAALIHAATALRCLFILLVAVIIVAPSLQLSSLQAAAQSITECATPTADSYPASIVAGPDGNLWFTESNARQDRHDLYGRGRWLQHIAAWR